MALTCWKPEHEQSVVIILIYFHLCIVYLCLLTMVSNKSLYI